MDIRIRRNEQCVIGLPRCDYVFSSTRSCFIAYGFETSPLETAILRRLLEERGVEAVEAGGTRAPGQNAFCAKICSKIITSQFCIILLNQDSRPSDRTLVPNANVNMEYGLMLGFNKYVVPFQRRDHELPFNVAGLDTIKYDQRDFERVAADAIDQAIRETTPPATEHSPPAGEGLFLFLLDEGYVAADVSSEGDKMIFSLGSSLGFNLLTNHGGTRYVFVGNFSHLRAESVIWRTKMLVRSVDGRRESWPVRVAAGILTEENARLIESIFADFRVWLLIGNEGLRAETERALSDVGYEVRIITPSEVAARLDALGDVLS